MRYGISYFGVRDPRHVRRDLDEIAEAGFGTITHTFSEHDLRFHRGDLGRIIDESRERGLEVALDPWGVGGLFGGEAYSELALVEPDSRQIDADGRSVPACCPNAPETRGLLRRWTRAAVALRPDVLFWDEPHFYLGAFRSDPPRPACRCAACGRAWAGAGGGDRLPEEGHPDLARFRTESLRDMLQDAISVAKGAPIRHSLCLLPRFEYAGAGSDDWATFAALDGLDRLATDPYWMDRPVEPAAFVREHAEPLVALARETGREAEIWIQGIRIEAGREVELERAIDAARALEPDVISIWSFRATDRMSALRCEDPEAAWATILRAVDEGEAGGGPGEKLSGPA